MRVAPILLLVACGARPAPAPPTVTPPDAAVPITIVPTSDPRPVDGLLIDWEHATWETDDEALALWQQLELNGDNYSIRIEEIPHAPREAMAKAMLRQGNFACAGQPMELACGIVEPEFLAVEPDATLDDPCLRRRLALWSIDNLEDSVLVGELAPDAVALAALPAPEGDLNRAVLYRVLEPAHEALHLQMLDALVQAGNREIAGEALGGLSQAGLEHAALQLHIDGALELMDLSLSMTAFGKALLSPELRRETRVRAVHDLGDYFQDTDPMDPTRAEAFSALTAATKVDDCAVAGAARAERATIVNGAFPEPWPKNAKPASLMRLICEVVVAGGDEPAMWRKLVDAKGVVLRRHVNDPQRVAYLWEDYPDAVDADKDGAPDVEEADPDGDGNPATATEIEHIPLEDMLIAIPYLDEIIRALPECQGTTCRVPGLDVEYKFKFRKGAKGLVLDAIERNETIGDC